MKNDPNLKKDQLRTINEIKNDDKMGMYQYDKGNGFV